MGMRGLSLPALLVLFFLEMGLATLSADPLPGHLHQLTPIRATVHQDGYTIDSVGDKKQPADSDWIRILLRISHGDKVPIKPEDVVLIDRGGRSIDPEDRDDEKVGNEENSGLPLTVSSGADSYGNAGAGVGLNLNQLFGPHGKYSYTKINFKRTDFVSGQKLKITMPDGKKLVFSLSEIAN